VHTLDGFRSIPIQEDFDVLPRKPFRARGRTSVDSDHRLTVPGEQTNGRLARPSQPNDQVGTWRKWRAWLEIAHPS
jgi:hypothetical protein